MSPFFQFLNYLTQRIIAPPFCPYCRSYLEKREPLCRSCIVQVKPILSTTLKINERYSMPVYAVSAYEDPLKTLILAKERKDYEASVHLGKLIERFSVITSLPCDYQVPVPLHSRRYSKRGYNQALVMAQQIGSIPVLDCIKRVKRTVKQSLCSQRERHENIENAFVPMPTLSLITGKVVVIIDDLMTSGATLREMGRTLALGNPKQIYAVVACCAL